MNENKTICLFIQRQKLLNIPEKTLIRHNRKSIRAYDNNLRHNYDMSQTSSLNITIKNGKQENNL